MPRKESRSDDGGVCQCKEGPVWGPATPIVSSQDRALVLLTDTGRDIRVAFSAAYATGR
jgi:hypothetical protein